MTRPICASLLLCAICCRPAAERQPATDSSALRPSRAANDFDPETVRHGSAIAALVLDSIERQRTPSGEWIGRAWFSGALSLTGETFRHPDGDDYPYPCFEADTSSASRLPHWTGDSRRAWFCFENYADAKAQLGAAPGLRKSVVVDRFTIHRNLSDAVNSARLVDVAPGSPRTGL